MSFVGGSAGGRSAAGATGSEADGAKSIQKAMAHGAHEVQGLLGAGLWAVGLGRFVVGLCWSGSLCIRYVALAYKWLPP